MPGMYTAEMLAMKYGRVSHEIRQALMASGVEINLDDQVDVDAAEAADDKVKKFLADKDKARLDERAAATSADTEKAKWLEAHNKKVEADLAKNGGWAGAVAAAASGGKE